MQLAIVVLLAAGILLIYAGVSNRSPREIVESAFRG